ncbi:MAG TPA: uroporphyrinogen-III synthase [Burkholderiales bacterium]|jgi:uroporphyrinogen-III synthase|nr:uroporphyrinogen-III synthase [Burkholderiales bacterium]
MRGRRVAVLESRLGREMVELLEKRGAKVVHAPALAEVPDLDPGSIAALVASLRSRPAAVAIFQTAVGTRALFAATDSLGLTSSLSELLGKSLVVARGPKPSAALRARSVRIDRNAAEPFTTREILACLHGVPLQGARVLVQRYGAANAELERELAQAGAEVVEVPTYRWALPQDTQPLEALVGALERGELDAAVFTNGEQARNLLAVAAKMGREAQVRSALNEIVVASIGPVASAALREAGVQVGVEARPPKLGALLGALQGAFAP